MIVNHNFLLHDLKNKNDFCCTFFLKIIFIFYPGDVCPGYHAVALSHVFSLGDEDFLQNLPGRVKQSKVIIVGIRSMEPEAAVRNEEI